MLPLSSPNRALTRKNGPFLLSCLASTLSTTYGFHLCCLFPRTSDIPRPLIGSLLDAARFDVGGGGSGDEEAGRRMI